MFRREFTVVECFVILNYTINCKCDIPKDLFLIQFYYFSNFIVSPVYKPSDLLSVSDWIVILFDFIPLNWVSCRIAFKLILILMRSR